MKKKPLNGVKYDNGKARWDLLDWGFLDGIAEVLSFGARKYDDDNWKKLDNIRSRYIAACGRHVKDYWLCIKSEGKEGSIYDDESGLHHLLHAGCCLMFVFWYDRMNPLRFFTRRGKNEK